MAETKKAKTKKIREPAAKKKAAGKGLAAKGTAAKKAVGKKSAGAKKTRQPGTAGKMKGTPKKGRGKKTPAEKAIAKKRARIKAKARHVFKGRFGKRAIRRPGKGKWGVWRHPRGIDIKRKKQYGLIPKPGYKTPRSIRFLHPSGMPEVLVGSGRDLEKVPGGYAVRIASGIGTVKKKALVKEAEGRGLKILNG